MNVLIAEDDVTTRAMLTAVIGRWGFEVARWTDGVQAWSSSGTGWPATGLLDWMMPGHGRAGGLPQAPAGRAARTAVPHHVHLAHRQGGHRQRPGLGRQRLHRQAVSPRRAEGPIWRSAGGCSNCSGRSRCGSGNSRPRWRMSRRSREFSRSAATATRSATTRRSGNAWKVISRSTPPRGFRTAFAPPASRSNSRNSTSKCCKRKPDPALFLELPHGRRPLPTGVPRPQRPAIASNYATALKNK